MEPAGFPLFPEQASTIAAGVDHMYLFLVLVAGFFSALIFILIFVFAVKYRRRSEDQKAEQIEGSLKLEIAWTVIPLLITFVMFGLGAALYVRNSRPPVNAVEVFVVGKQWMWKLQHVEGQREIDELHVPVGRPVKLTMTSEDVIHDFFVPAFRVKKDVIPGRYSTIWFQATKVGKYHLFCAQYCGAQHSGMTGWIYVMKPADYENWLSGGGAESMESSGEKLFARFGCVNCHHADGSGRGPSLAGVFGKPVQLESGETVTADEAYVRESILAPNAKIVKGYPAIMPTFQGLVSEEQLLQLIAYVKSLRTGERTTR